MPMTNKKNAIRQGGVGFKMFQWSSALFLFLFALICIYPFWYVLIYSLSSTSGAASGLTLFPKGFTLVYYYIVLRIPDIYNAFFISLMRSVIGTVITLFFSSMLAYVLTKDALPGRKLIYRVMVTSMYISVGLIPWYLTMRMFGLKNNFMLYVLPSAVGAFYVILIKTFMESSIPESLDEAALVDGANYFQIFLKITLPLSKAVLAAVAVFSAVGQWNSWTDNFYLVNDPNLQTMQYMLLKLLRQTEAIAAAVRNGNLQALKNIKSISPMSIRMTTTVVTIIPILLAYPFLQRYFVKGIMLGAVKG